MEKACWNCMGGQGETEGVGCADCRAGNPPSNWRASSNYVPNTKADSLRAMSDEELADQLVIKIDGLAKCSLYLSAPIVGMFVSRKDAWRETLNWLRQPAEEGG